MQIQYFNIDELRPYEKNPRKNDQAVDGVKASIKEFGFKVPIIIDSNRSVVCGHTRIKAAQKLDISSVPCIVADDLTPAQIKAFRILDNKVSEAAEWDSFLLKDELTELEAMDYKLDDFDLNFSDDLREANNAVDTSDDEVPDISEQVISKLGDVWICGRHRVMCGDCTDIEQIDVVLKNGKPELLITDPPYGMFLNTDFDQMFSSDASHRKTGHRFENVKGDHEDFNQELIKVLFQKFDYVKEMFIWGADYFSELIPNRKNGSWVVWDKRCGEDMDKVTGNTFELCWSKEKHKRLIARILWSGHHGMQNDDTKSRIHPTQKPIALTVWFLEKWGIECHSVVDPFLGSGTTLIACERLNRTCYGMEIEPHYVDVICRRFYNETKQVPVRESDNKPFPVEEFSK